MVNINLSQGQTSSAKMGVASQGPWKHFVGPLSVIIIALAGWGALAFFSKKVGADIDAIKAQSDVFIVGQAGNSFADAADRVVDFQQRLNAIVESKAQAESSGPVAVLERMAERMVPGAYIESFTQDSENVTVTVSCGSYEIAAKQIRSFKDSNAFSDIAPAFSAAVNQSQGGGGISLALTMRYAPEAVSASDEAAASGTVRE